MTPEQLDMVRRVATAAQQKDADIGMSAAVVVALLDEIDTLRGRLAVVERIVQATRTILGELMTDVLAVCDAQIEAQP